MRRTPIVDLGDFLDELLGNQKPKKPLASGSLVIRFFNGVTFDVPFDTKVTDSRPIRGKDQGIHFKHQDFNFTVRPKVPEFDI